MKKIFTTTPVGSNDEADRVEGEAIKHNYYNYLIDESKLEGDANILYFPKNELHIANFLEEMNAKRIPVTISGGRTGIVGGAVPSGGAILTLEKMNKITGLRREGNVWIVRVQSGMTLKEFRDAVENGKIENYLSKSFHDWKALKRFLAEYRDYFYPPDPTEETATLGGTVATDASGSRSYMYGSTRPYVKRLRIILADGNVLDIKRGAHRVNNNRLKIYGTQGQERELTIADVNIKGVKNVAGYFMEEGMDFIDLFIGSEGTLGVISEVELLLKRRPGEFASLLIFFNSEDSALSFASNLDRYPNIVSIEFFDNSSLLLLREEDDFPKNITIDTSTTAMLIDFFYRSDEELEKLGSKIEEGLKPYRLGLEDTYIGIGRGEISKLHFIRHRLPQKVNEEIAERKKKIPELHKIGTDTAVPRSRIIDLLRFYRGLLLKNGLEHLIFGHLGEGHIHVNILPRDVDELDLAKSIALELAEMAVKLNGSISGEHGIGKLKRDLMEVMYNESQIEAMLKIKKTLDPNFMLCPENLFPTDYLRSYDF